MNESVIRKTFSLPPFIAHRLDELASNTGFSQSNLVLQALTAYLHTYEIEGSLEHWLEWLGRTSGMYEYEKSDEVEAYEEYLRQNGRVSYNNV